MAVLVARSPAILVDG